MMFCPECKSMLMSSGGQLKCRKCGYSRRIDGADRGGMAHKSDRSENEITILEPHYTKLKCPNCGRGVQTVCLGPRIIPNYDSESVEKGYLVECAYCSYSWYFQYNSLSLNESSTKWDTYVINYEELSEGELDEELNKIDKGNHHYN